MSTDSREDGSIGAGWCGGDADRPLVAGLLRRRVG